MDEVQTGNVILRKRCVKASAHLARDVLDDVFTEKTLDILEDELNKRIISW